MSDIAQHLDDATARAFIAANTKAASPPLVPEIVLRLADESVPIWLASETLMGLVNAPPPFWAFAWAGGQALARYTLDHAALFEGKSVLDLGTGSGLTAIASMKAGARHVLAADIDPLSLVATRLNAQANGVAVEITSADLLGDTPGAFDVVIVGDLFYERQLADRVWTFLSAASHNGAHILIGDPKRTYFPTDKCTIAATYDVPVTRELEDALIKPTSVWQLRG